MTGLSRPKICLTLQPLALVRAAVKLPPAANCHHVVRQRVTAQREDEVGKLI